MSRTKNGQLTGNNQHPEIRRDLIFSLENEHEVPDARGHLLISKCKYKISPNLGMLVNARQVPVFGFGSSLMCMCSVIVCSISRQDWHH